MQTINTDIWCPWTSINPEEMSYHNTRNCLGVYWLIIENIWFSRKWLGNCGDYWHIYNFCSTDISKLLCELCSEQIVKLYILPNAVHVLAHLWVNEGFNTMFIIYNFSIFVMHSHVLGSVHEWDMLDWVNGELSAFSDCSSCFNQFEWCFRAIYLVTLILKICMLITGVCKSRLGYILGPNSYIYLMMTAGKLNSAGQNSASPI